MHRAAREDFLEAVLRLESKLGRRPTSDEVALRLSLDPDAAREAADALAREGALEGSPDRGIALTQAGRETAERVCRKHRILECFLEETLGIDGRSASKEACVLEHAVSDETIERLSGEFGPLHGAGAGIRPLTEFSEGDEVAVALIRGSGRRGRLADLGVLPGERVTVRRKLANDGIVVAVKGCDVALSPEVASTIYGESPG
jgi:DtxR family Mn-dependent transcriptional regulator